MRNKCGIATMMAAMMAMMSIPGYAFDSHEKDDAKTMLTTYHMKGAKVVDASGEHIATVRDLVLNRQGEVLYLLTGVGGYAGVLESQIAIPARAATCACEVKDGNQTCNVAVSMTRERINESPKIESRDHSELIDSNWVTRNNSHFTVEDAATVPKAGEIFLLSEIDGQKVICNEGKEFGHVSDLVVVPAKSKARYAILGYGGTLGVGKSFIAVPFSALNITRNSDNDGWNVSVNQSHAGLEALPKVTSPNYAELQNETSRKAIDDAFRAEK